jgi:hypothetical protein
MDAEPSIVCGSDTGPHRTLVTVAAVSIVLYVLGVPSIFLAILLRNRVQVRAKPLGNLYLSVSACWCA